MSHLWYGDKPLIELSSIFFNYRKYFAKVIDILVKGEFSVKNETKILSSVF